MFTVFSIDGILDADIAKSWRYSRDFLQEQ